MYSSQELKHFQIAAEGAELEYPDDCPAFQLQRRVLKHQLLLENPSLDGCPALKIATEHRLHSWQQRSHFTVGPWCMMSPKERESSGSFEESDSSRATDDDDPKTLEVDP